MARIEIESSGESSSKILSLTEIILEELLLENFASVGCNSARTRLTVITESRLIRVFGEREDIEIIKQWLISFPHSQKINLIINNGFTSDKDLRAGFKLSNKALERLISLAKKFHCQGLEMSLSRAIHLAN